MCERRLPACLLASLLLQILQQHTPECRRYGELLGAMQDELKADKRFNNQETTLSASSSFDIMSHRTKLRL
jgi:hypothetical protein